MLEILNRSLMGFRGLPGAERTQISPTARLGIFLAREETVLPGFEFSNQTAPRYVTRTWP
jgi:hypothetical protein